MKVFVVTCLLLQVLLKETSAQVKPINPAHFEMSSDIEQKKPKGGNKWRMAAKDENLRWRDATIVYQIALTAFNDQEIKELEESMRDFEKETCLKFRRATNKDPYSVVIRMGSGGCNAILGQTVTRGVQTVNLGYGCRFYGLFLHELGHTIGLHHEHQHPDRDQGVTIDKNNVTPSMRQWFDTISRSELNFYGVKYDMQSIMHYGEHAFASSPELVTIKAKDPSKQRWLYFVYMKDLSWGDAKRINLMYKCNAHCKNVNCPNGFVTKDCKCETPQMFAKRRCFNRKDDAECEKKKNECNGQYPYEMFTQCRKTCGKCYEAV